ncbi:ParB/RepB/Spo0J family partition protein [Candidatus Nitrospira inopinata]|jgi:ParB family chromosome partitioning protein|uniref:Putative chromosome-partitioning protein ParB n=1 Tax=Candidatus Nitrospira inopinata TaxID=1715989 RepID=A0A0S4KN54_9BACT|nr:ParB/RepB/Spo0J family partition protein [Candidatus Nitrospira inopinata]CUQ65875.1 putative chromosome-partitioning protein ParB [Candidatus Nitrospira inopinata]
MEKKALGKGLDALLPSLPGNHPVEGGDIQHLRVEDIVPNRYQPRQHFSPQELAELAASIHETGMLQPIMVRRKGDGIFELISGERRWRASKEAGLKTVRAIVRNCSDEEAILIALIENLQRSDLNPMEIARAYSRMMNEFGLTHEMIAKKVGCDRSSVANAVRLTNLHPEVQKLVENQALSAGHAKVILGIESPESQLEVSKKVVAQGLSVRETEKMVASILRGNKRNRRAPHDQYRLDLESKLQKKLGTKVMIQPRGKGGKIIIRYFSPEELEGIVETVLS